jgi:hypothetical protein
VCSVRATGPVEVPFQNDSLVTLLAHVMAIIGSVEQTMLAQGSDSDKCELGLNSSVMFLFYLGKPVSGSSLKCCHF